MSTLGPAPRIHAPRTPTQVVPASAQLAVRELDSGPHGGFALIWLCVPYADLPALDLPNGLRVEIRWQDEWLFLGRGPVETVAGGPTGLELTFRCRTGATRIVLNS